MPHASVAGRQPSPAPSAEPGRAARAHALVSEHFAFVWRVCRRLGATSADADDAAQRTMAIALERLADVQPGSERGFLYRVAANVVSKMRRGRERHPEHGPEALDDLADRSSDPEALVAARRSLDLLDRILAALDPDLRAVFVLFEIEQLEKNEVAEALGIPPGTAASRLRRAREEFMRQSARRGLTRPAKGASR